MLHKLTTALPFQGAEIGCQPIPWALPRAGSCTGPSGRKTGRGDFTNRGPSRHALAVPDTSGTDETSISTPVRPNRMNHNFGCGQRPRCVNGGRGSTNLDEPVSRRELANLDILWRAFRGRLGVAYPWSNRATAWTEMASSRPSGPTPSLVLALTEISSIGMSRQAARLERMA